MRKIPLHHMPAEGNIFFTSDLHFFHKRIITLSNRPFKDADEMHEALIANWNSVVGPNDIVYILGDFSFGAYEKTKTILQRLNGKKYLCMGNHDELFDNNTDLGVFFIEMKDYFELEYVKKDGTTTLVCMSHFPMITWHKSHSGSYMLHGHCHGNLKYPFIGRIMDVGTDPNNYTPVNIRDIEDRMEKINSHVIDHHGKTD